MKKTKKIKIVNESNINYTFLDAGVIKNNSKTGNDTTDKTESTIDKDLVKMRFIDTEKSKFRHRSRLQGGQNKQGHSSVYE